MPHLRPFPASFLSFPLLTGILLGSATPSEAQETNRYRAPFAEVAPILDGIADPVWASAPWDSLPYNYLPGTPMPSASDLSARYKVLWTAEALHLLVEVVDDSVSDRTVNPLQGWWNDDCVEIFLDENHDGGDHQYNFDAWAYHVGIKGDAVDYGDDLQPHLFNDHVLLRRVQTADTSVWEMTIKVYGEGYTLEGPNTPQVLSAPRTMGFSLAYCDNDGKTTRESFLGSVNTPGHLANEGYIDASVFGALDLLPGGSTSATREVRSPLLEKGPDGFRLNERVRLRIRGLDGRLVQERVATPGAWVGSDLPSGLYLVEASTDQRRHPGFVFAKP